MTTSIYSKEFWKSATERAGKTAIQTFIPAAGGAAFSLFDIDYVNAGQITLSAVVLSYLMSLLSGLNGTGPSAIGAEIKVDAVVLDEVELDAVETQKLLDEMIVEDEVPTDDDLEVIEDDEKADEIEDRDYDAGAREGFEPDEVDDTPVGDDYEPRH